MNNFSKNVWLPTQAAYAGVVANDFLSAFLK